MKLMTSARLLLYALLLSRSLVAGVAPEAGELSLGNVSAMPGGVVSVPLTLSSPAPVQALVAVFEWDPASGAAVGVNVGSALADADLTALRADLDSNFVIVSSILDTDGQGAEVIPAGTDIPLASAEIRCLATEGSFALRFVDNVHATVDGGPPLENVLVVDGLSLAKEQGLQLVDGSIECVESRFVLTAEDGKNDITNAEQSACGDVRILMTNSEPVDGFVVAVCHDPAVLALEAIELGEATLLTNADFSSQDIFADGGTLGVIVELTPPFESTRFPPGTEQHVATYRYCCVSPPAAGEPDVITPIRLCDNVLGAPLRENLLVVGTRSVTVDTGLVLNDGEFTCQPIETPQIEICDNGTDDDGDELIDCDDSDCAADVSCVPDGLQQVFACGGRDLVDGVPGPLSGSPGSPVEVCFFVKNPEDNRPPDEQIDQVQGFSMALTFCCDLVADDTLDVTGTILENIGADFLAVQADNTEADGDGCEFVIGLLLDASPPFDGAVLPPSPDFQRIGCTRFEIRDTASCGTCCQIQFTDGINGSGTVPVKNLVAVDNFARVPELVNCEVCIRDTPKFFRGDCNFSGQEMGMGVDIADVAAVVSFLMASPEWVFLPPCLDSCDCNDDGRIDLADATCILQYAVRGGSFPPAPGPGLQAAATGLEPTEAGPDPTDDKLDCAAGGACAETPGD